MSTAVNDIDNSPFVYKVTNKSLEVLTDYFDIVPDGNLFLHSGMPIFAVRMRHTGIEIVAKEYKKKHNIQIDVHTYIAEEEGYSIYSSHAKMLYNEEINILNKLNFDNMKNKCFRGIIITIVNKQKRLMHAIPIIYGLDDASCKVVIFLDPYFECFGQPDMSSTTMLGARYFYDKIPNVKIYCHNQYIQADRHSCGIFACIAIKNMLAHAAKNLKANLKTAVPMNLKADDLIFPVYQIQMHEEILKLAQVSSTLEAVKNKNIDVSKYKISIDYYIENYSAILRYRRDRSSYHPDDIAILDLSNLDEKKKVNLKMLQKGHLYAEMIMKSISENEQREVMQKYNPRYWLKIIEMELKSCSQQSFRSILKNIKTYSISE